MKEQQTGTPARNVNWKSCSNGTRFACNVKRSTMSAIAGPSQTNFRPQSFRTTWFSCIQDSVELVNTAKLFAFALECVAPHTNELSRISTRTYVQSLVDISLHTSSTRYAHKTLLILYSTYIWTILAPIRVRTCAVLSIL